MLSTWRAAAVVCNLAGRSAGVLYRSGEMSEMLDELLPVVGCLYQAVAQPSDWPVALAAVADFLHGDHVLLWIGSGPTRRDTLLSTRIDHDEFARRHTAYETMRPEIERLMPEGPVTRNMLIPDSDYERDG